jgi:hypothetical protein
MNLRWILAAAVCTAVGVTNVGCMKGPAPAKPVDEHYEGDGHDHSHDHDHVPEVKKP